jgi:hypothetical protein
MHHLRSRSIIHRFRIAAFLLCLRFVLAPASAGVLIYSVSRSDKQLTLVAAGLFVVMILSMALQCWAATRANCPLCMTAVLASRHCAKSRHARAVLGSHRLHVALSILFRKSFRCPYCNEPTAMEVRQHRQVPYARG